MSIAPQQQSSSSETLRAMQKLPEYTRHIERGPRSDPPVSFSALANDTMVVADAIRCNLLPQESGGGAPGIAYSTLDVAWNRLRRIRQMLVVTSATSPSTSTMSVAKDAESIYASLITTFGDATFPSATERPEEMHTAVLSASALSVFVAVALQDWEGLVSVVAPLNHETEIVLRDEATYVAMSSGLYGSTSMPSGCDGSTTATSFTASVTDRAILIGTKILLDSAMCAPADRILDSIFVNIGGESPSSSEADQRFLFFSSCLSQLFWAGDTPTMLNLFQKDKDKATEDVSCDSYSAAYLLKLTQLALTSPVYRQFEASGMPSRMASAFRPIPVQEASNTTKTNGSTQSQPQLFCPSDLLFRETTDLPTRFWGVPDEILHKVRLY